MSSALDVAECLYSLGYDLHVGLTGSSPFLYLLKDRRHYKTILPLNRMHAVAPEAAGLLWDEEPLLNISRIRQKSNQYGRSFLYELLGEVFSRSINRFSGVLQARRFHRILKKARVIIVACAFYRGAKEYLAEQTSAKLIMNHAGSVDAFENWWLTPKHLPNIPGDNLSLYDSFCRQFDGILFQTEDQAGESESKHASVRKRAIVIKPSCNEMEVLSAKISDSPYENGKSIIVCVGSLQSRKSQHRAIAAFEIISKYTGMRSSILSVLALRRPMAVVCRNCQKKWVFRTEFSSMVSGWDYLRYMAHATLLLQTSEAEGLSEF